MREKINPGFCVLPFYGIEYPGGKPCCLIKPGYSRQDVQASMLRGERPAACSTCWQLEDQNLISDRQLKNASLDVHWDRDIRYIEDDCYRGKSYINHYKIYTSNLCNAACATCSSAHSTRWASLENKHSRRDVTQQELDSIIDYKTAVVINFLGGESLLSKNNFYILEQLIHAGNTNCRIEFTTNGSVRLNAKQIDLVKCFKNLNFGISIDGTDRVFEYLRWPLKWHQVEANINYFRSVSDNVSVCQTTSNLNIYYYCAFEQWMISQNLAYHYNVVNYPLHFQPSALPEPVKQKILDQFGYNTFVQSQLDHPHRADDDRNFNNFLLEIARQDQLKRINIRDYLPEFCDLIGI